MSEHIALKKVLHPQGTKNALCALFLLTLHHVKSSYFIMNAALVGSHW